jgi:hypothetical protein
MKFLNYIDNKKIIDVSKKHISKNRVFNSGNCSIVKIHENLIMNLILYMKMK